ncbi:transcriptional regulator, ArsR family [Corynebacterium efficiens YS-314]|uniref:Putative transcription regulator n=1 Tax=Corynebacterium efficiens (strain DSM 44549 / YS-314 / AJ 12310 / JCM 11189 / NBRC 100395) TaxID=196164 RepID=Q8FR22_COREF|nr:metalloregulator ArsR/SmtB family transcription factor [Corynebacterium efficiens]EEW49923.1 transcriptional regulator, ArsR family [Corynebacterium efficiens YS-314]BAC17755.1 putative transcription regulator [Corynebacterium efficiens YS-314]
MFSSQQLPLYERKANLFKGLAHPYRIRILEILSTESQVPVSAMIQETGLESSHLSQHLAVLRKYGLVTSERNANAVSYSLTHPQVADLLRTARALLNQMLAHSSDQLTSISTLPDIEAHPEQNGTQVSGVTTA